MWCALRCVALRCVALRRPVANLVCELVLWAAVRGARTHGPVCRPGGWWCRACAQVGGDSLSITKGIVSRVCMVSERVRTCVQGMCDVWAARPQARSTYKNLSVFLQSMND
jgi:hypothetical protein